MALITRCPSCGTAFRITPFHLQAHGGDVRCGRCAKVFNGFSTLATMQEPEAVVAAIAEGAETPYLETPSAAPEAAPEAAHEAAPKHGPEPAPKTDTIGSEADLEQLLSAGKYSSAWSAKENPQAQPSADAPAAHDTFRAEPYISGWREPGESAATAPQQEDLGDRGTGGVAPGTEHGMREDYAFAAAEPSVSPFWSIAVLFLLLVLAAQALYFYRNDVVDAIPAAKPLLDQYCKLLGCKVQPPLRPELLNIESSEMRRDIRDSSKIILNATVRNYAPYPQAFPSFEVTLMDTRDQPMASRIFSPDSYLEKNEIRPNAVRPDYEFHVRLLLEGDGSTAAGYRLSLIYPGS